MSLVPNLSASAPSTFLFAQAGTQNASVPPDIIVSSITSQLETIYPYIEQGDSFTKIRLGGDDVPPASAEIRVDAVEGSQPRVRLGCLSSLANPVIQSEITMYGTSSFTGVYSQFGDGKGGLDAVKSGLVMNQIGDITLLDNTNIANNITLSPANNQITINTDNGFGLLLNGAPPPSNIVSTAMTNATYFSTSNTERLGSEQAVFMTSTFQTLPNCEYRISWSDTLTCITGTPAASDCVLYQINNATILETSALSEISTIGRAGGISRSHNFTWVATNEDTQLEFLNSTINCSTIVTINDLQPIRVQLLGPYYEAAAFASKQKQSGPLQGH